MGNRKKSYYERLESLSRMAIIMFALADEGVLDDELNLNPNYGLGEINSTIEEEHGFKSLYPDIDGFNADLVEMKAALDDRPDPESLRPTIKAMIENVVCATRGNDAKGAYEYGEKVAEGIIKLMGGK